MIAGAEFSAIPGAGHELWRENAKDFAAVLREFLLQG
jgi:pimeloyl-ACP methyl ester carboxylesterase